MKNKFLLIIGAILTSIIGFSGGFAVTKSITSKNNNATIADAGFQELYGAAILYDAKNKKEVTEVKNIEEVKPIESKSNATTKKVGDCPTPKKDYIDESYMDVGQDVSLEDKSYIPDNLVELEESISKYDNLCLKEEARDALNIMIEDAKKEKLNIVVSSGFRDFNTQKDILKANIASGNKNATKLVAKPGYSEHQLGLAVDFTSPSIGNVSATGKFGDTKESKWLEDHASEYGFIESYPKGKEAITGYLYEPWHYRYVGVDYAKEIVTNSQTINEYLKAKKEDNKNKNTL